MREGAETTAQLPSLSLSLSCSVRVAFSFCIKSANFLYCHKHKSPHAHAPGYAHIQTPEKTHSVTKRHGCMGMSKNTDRPHAMHALREITKLQWSDEMNKMIKHPPCCHPNPFHDQHAFFVSIPFPTSERERAGVHTYRLDHVGGLGYVGNGIVHGRKRLLLSLVFLLLR
jgi:hypothetical protein